MSPWHFCNFWMIDVIYLCSFENKRSITYKADWILFPNDPFVLLLEQNMASKGLQCAYDTGQTTGNEIRCLRKIPKPQKNKLWTQEEDSLHCRRLREDPFRLTPPTFGHCPNSNWPPPPALNRALWGTFFQAIFYHSAGLYASENGKCPKPSGQAFRPPPQTGNAQMEGASKF